MSKKTLRKPEYPDDFEDLCFRLWKESHNCSIIQKNGRKGQSQNGVDIYGKTKEENSYFGIQCKVKEENLGSYIKKEDILEEVEKAKTFKPTLGTYYIATTSSRDANIQEFVRELDEKHSSNGLFEIDIFFWEDIVDLLDENKKTYDWFIKNKNFIKDLKLDVCFDNGSTSAKFKPLFKKNILSYGSRETFESLMGVERMNGLIKSANEIFFENDERTNFPNFYLPSLNLNRDRKISNADEYFKHHNRIFRDYADKIESECQPRYAVGHLINESITNNHSIITFRIRVKNTGKSPIESLRFTVKIPDVDDVEIVDKSPSLLISLHQDKYNVEFLESGDLLFEKDILLVSEDCTLDAICLRPQPKPSEIKINWKALAVDFEAKGELKILSEPEIEENAAEVYLEEANDKVDEVINDYVTDRSYYETLEMILSVNNL
ncbi:MAG: hypothetical protein AAGL34_13885 [Bacteroidota bacterium]